MAVGMYYAAPMVALFYFMSTQHQINVSYYMFIYYFTGNMIFGVSIYEVMGLSVDRPIHALLNLKGDVEEAERNQDYKLASYMENFRASELFDGVPGAGDAGRAGASSGATRGQQAALLAGQGQTGAAAMAGGKAKLLRDTSGTAGGLGRDRATAATEAQRDPSD